MANKKDIVKAVLTRLKPNVYIDNHPFWKRLEKGLQKLNIFELDALESLIVCNRIKQSLEKIEQKELF